MMREKIANAEKRCVEAFQRIEEMELYHTERVLRALQAQQVAARHFAPTTGYGYDDIGRDTLERLFADLFGAEAAIVRPQIASGTHAISLCLFGMLRPGDGLLSVTGKPYDTLDGVIGISEISAGSLREMGVDYQQVEMTKDGLIDLPAVAQVLRANPHIRVLAAQRSRGYSLRRSLLPGDVGELSEFIKKEFPHIALMVDNCYGEFVCEKEPTHFGADICVGSLIKNPGGGLAPTGGYIVGREDLIERISYRLTAPGIGREVGSYAGSYQPFFQGLFTAPHVVAQALKTATLAAAVLADMGMETTPGFDEERTDIIQALTLGRADRLIAFCQGIQAASPIDSMAMPEPWDMPGYQHQVIMAAGTFVSGASIELSADAPMREPYVAYLQGGLTYGHGKLAILRTLESMEEKGLL